MNQPGFAWFTSEYFCLWLTYVELLHVVICDMLFFLLSSIIDYNSKDTKITD